MNRVVVDRIAEALLYEGYLLYPYRPSVKNRQRWTFGGLYPASYAVTGAESDRSMVLTQCLVRGGPASSLSVSVRFLHLVVRRVGVFDGQVTDWPACESLTLRFVESLRVGDEVLHAWQEAREREVRLEDSILGELADHPRYVTFGFGSEREREPVRDASGTIVGIVEREQRSVDGAVTLAAEVVDDGVYRITVSVENRTPFNIAARDDRDEVLLHTFVSTHTALGVEAGAFVSLLDPPESLRELVADCRNVGTWPVLVGTEGVADTMLSSPIILYDYPRLAPESPGDLFDATEIDEILTLRIMTLTDEEKREVAALDSRGRALLERTDSLSRDQLMGLHGTYRERSQLAGGHDHGSVGSD